MTKLGIFAVTILAAAGACCGVEARAADAKTCTGLWDFIETDCQLTWYGITLYGAIDRGSGTTATVMSASARRPMAR